MTNEHKLSEQIATRCGKFTAMLVDLHNEGRLSPRESKDLMEELGKQILTKDAEYVNLLESEKEMIFI